MVIRNTDGTAYKASGTLSQLIPDSPSHELFNSWDKELIRAGGSPLLYYEVIIPSNSIDPLYVESRSKLFSTYPIEIFAIYDPIASQFNQGVFGADGPDQMTFYVNYSDAIDRIGHLPVIGSYIFSPHLREHWEILDRKLADFHRWKVYHVEIHCQRFQESLTQSEGKVTEKTKTRPSFEID